EVVGKACRTSCGTKKQQDKCDVKENFLQFQFAIIFKVGQNRTALAAVGEIDGRKPGQARAIPLKASFFRQDWQHWSDAAGPGRPATYDFLFSHKEEEEELR
ncbi:unnamed protein product, partial [Amoebophrya sp. A120]